MKSMQVTSAENVASLKRRDQRVVRLEDFSDEDMAQIAAAEVSVDYAHLDEELTDWHE